MSRGREILDTEGLPGWLPQPANALPRASIGPGTSTHLPAAACAEQRFWHLERACRRRPLISSGPGTLARLPLQVRDRELKELLGEARFFSVTYRLFKLPEAMETLCEDYGQACKYLVRTAGGRTAGVPQAGQHACGWGHLTGGALPHLWPGLLRPPPCPGALCPVAGCALL